jgi:hypothetical protein
VYWLINQLVPREEWEPLALGLKHLAKDLGLLADPSRTADISSIMRYPDTWNNKSNPPLVVNIIRDMEPIPLHEFASLMPEQTVTNYAATEEDEFDLPDNYPPSSGMDAADKCAQLAQFRDTNGNLEEPLWYAGIGVLQATVEGGDLVHAWSSGHPDYSPEETNKKLAQQAGYGPTTCSRFEFLNPEGCAGCPFKGEITSPIQLGTTVTPKEPEPERPWADIVKVGSFFKVGDEGVLFAPPEESPERVLEEPLYIENIGRIGYEDAIATVHWRSLTGKWHTSEMSLTVLGDDKSMRGWLLTHSIITFGKVSKVRQYLKDYATQISREVEPDLICRRFGWDGLKHFMLGQARVSRDELTPVRVDKALPKEMRDHLVRSGSLEEWTEATKILAKDEYWMHAFALLASLAAPLFRVVDMSGAVVSFAGKSGAAKTTATSFGLSVWGHPKALTASPQGTLNSKGELLRSANNLPLLVDDVSSYSRMLSSLVYMAANGKAKERVSKSGQVYGQEEWQTVMMLTTNSPVLDLPETMLGEAERRRVLEFSVDTPMAAADAIALNEVMRDNYGVAGPPYLQHVIESSDYLIDEFNRIYKQWLADPEIPEENRFGIWLIAAAQVAGQLAHSIGLIAFEPASITTKAIEVLKRKAEEIRDPDELVQEAISAFINEHLGSIAVLNKDRSWGFCPERETLMVVRRDEGIICIPNHRLKKLMFDWNIPVSYLDKWSETNVLDTKQVKMSPTGSREYCRFIKLPDDVPEFEEEL